MASLRILERRLSTIVAHAGHAEAQFILGNCFAQGEGVERDEVRANRTRETFSFRSRRGGEVLFYARRSLGQS